MLSNLGNILLFLNVILSICIIYNANKNLKISGEIEKNIIQFLVSKDRIPKEMKAKRIEVGAEMPKKYDNDEAYELIHIANCFPELREKG